MQMVLNLLHAELNMAKTRLEEDERGELDFKIDRASYHEYIKQLEKSIDRLTKEENTN